MAAPAAPPVIAVEGLSKAFSLHAQGVRLPVIEGAALAVQAGECVALTGPSGAGKSTLLRLIWGNYLAGAGSIRILGTEIVGADPRTILALRRDTLGYVSQFLRILPRVPAIDVVAEPLLALGTPREEARARAGLLLARLAIPKALWGLSPLTFSGGEQQRVNIARGLAHPYPALLLDEPTASLDAERREAAMALIEEARDRGAAILGIFHDEAARARLCARAVDVGAFARAAEGGRDGAPTEEATAGAS